MIYKVFIEYDDTNVLQDMQNLLRDLHKKTHTMKTERVRGHAAHRENSFRTHLSFIPDDISGVKLALLQKYKLDLTL